MTRSGVLPEQIYLDYSQERLAAYGVQPSLLGDAIAARNITAPGGMLEIDGKNVAIDPSGELTNEQEIGDIVIDARAPPARRSTCATSSTSAATTRARRASSTT